MLVNTWSNGVTASLSGTNATGWAGRADAGEAGDDVAAPALIGMASPGPASARAAQATRIIPDLRIRMCRPPSRARGWVGYPNPQAERHSPRRGHYHGVNISGIGRRTALKCGSALTLNGEQIE